MFQSAAGGLSRSTISRTTRVIELLSFIALFGISRISACVPGPGCCQQAPCSGVPPCQGQGYAAPPHSAQPLPYAHSHSHEHYGSYESRDKYGSSDKYGSGYNKVAPPPSQPYYPQPYPQPAYSSYGPYSAPPPPPPSYPSYQSSYSSYYPQAPYSQSQYGGGKYIAADEYGVPPAGSIYMNAGEPGLLSPYPGGQAYPPGGYASKKNSRLAKTVAIVTTNMKKQKAAAAKEKTLAEVKN